MADEKALKKLENLIKGLKLVYKDIDSDFVTQKIKLSEDILRKYKELNKLDSEQALLEKALITINDTTDERKLRNLKTLQEEFADLIKAQKAVKRKESVSKLQDWAKGIKVQNDDRKFQAKAARFVKNLDELNKIAERPVIAKLKRRTRDLKEGAKGFAKKVKTMAGKVFGRGRGE